MFGHDPQHTGYTDCEMPDEMELLWKYKTSSHVDSSPAVVDGKIYFGSEDNYLYCLDTNGDLLWKYETGNYVDSSPAVVNGKVYFGSRDSYLYCLDTYGNLLWRYETANYVDSSPAVVNGKVYFGSNDGYLYCLDTHGKLLWKYKTGNCVFSSPAVVNGKVYFGSDDNYLYCLDTHGKLLWKYKTGSSVDSSSTVVNGKVYFGSRDTYLYCLDTHGKLLWKYETGRYFIASSPAVVNGKVYFGCGDGCLYCLGPKEQEVIQATFTVLDAFENTPIDGAQVKVESLEKTTDSQGKAVLSLEPGTYNVRVEKENHDDGTGAGYVETITLGADTEKIVKLYKKDYDLIIGTIHFDDNTVPYQVVAYQDGKASPYQTTSPDINGNFTMEVETGHTYEVGVVGYEDQKVRVVLSQTLDSPKTNPITINISGSVFGVVSEELGKVVVGATVKLYTQEDTLVTSVTSSNKGFTIDNVAPGNYCIEVEMEGYEKFRSSLFTVKPKERYNIGTLELKAQKGVLNVTVQDKDENKLNAEVTIKFNNEVVEKKTAENGEVSFQLNGGKYTIEASLEGYKTETVETDVFGGKTVTKSIILLSSQSNTFVYLGIFAAIVICVFAVYYITKKKSEKEVIEEPTKKKPEEKPKLPKEESSPKLQKLLQERDEWRAKLEYLKNNKDELIKEGAMSEEYYQQRSEEIINKLVDIEDKIIQEKIKGGKKK